MIDTCMNMYRSPAVIYITLAIVHKFDHKRCLKTIREQYL